MVTDTEATYDPLFLLVEDDYIIGTPGGVRRSSRTIDVCFNDLAENYDLQSKLNLASKAFIRPVWNPPTAEPSRGEELLRGVATYLASFDSDSDERKRKRDYLVNNGMLRILITTRTLLKEVRQTLNVARV